MAWTEHLTKYLPNINALSVGVLIIKIIAWLLILALVVGVAILWAWWYINKKKYNKIIIIWDKVDGKPTIVGRDIAKEIRLQGTEFTVFHLKKLNKYQPRPTIQTGVNTYWLAWTEDGELINIGLEDIDLVRRKAGIHFLDQEMRYQRGSLQRIIKDRYDKQTWWDKHGTTVLNIIYIVIIAVMTLLLFGKYLEIAGAVETTMDKVPEVLEKVNQVMSSLDNICSSSGGAYKVG